MKSFFLDDKFRIDRPGLFGRRVLGNRVPAWHPLSSTDRTVVSGHSLGDILFMWGNDYRGMLPRLMESAGIPGDTTQIIRKSTLPGSLVKGRWDLAPGVVMPVEDSARYGIADYQLMILMDGGPLAAIYSDERVQEDQLQEDLTHLKLFVDNAHQNGNGGAGAKVLYYTIWPFLSGYRGLTFREGLDAYEANSHYRVDWLIQQTGQYIHIVPGHRVMMRMWDDFQQGLLPGVTDWGTQIYMPEDPVDQRIHPNGLATYPIACLTHAIMYGESPVGLSYDWVTGPAITVEQALYFQQIAWEIATTYARAGLGGTDMGAVGLRVAPQQTPRQTLGSRLVAAVDFATGPLGPVSEIAGDGITLTTEIGTPTRMEGFTRFEDATMGGALAVPADRYVLRLMRMRSQRNEHYDVGVLFTNGQYGWGSPGGYVSMNEGTNGTYLEASSGMPEGIFRNRNLDEWALVEGWWTADGSAMRIIGKHPMATAAATSLPATSRLTIGGPLSNTHLPPNFDMAALVIASEVPTLEERDALIRWCLERLPPAA